MSILSDIQKLKAGPRELRKFGLLVGGMFLAIGIWFLIRHKPSYPFFLWPGIALVAFGALAPRTLKYIYIAWMAVAFTLGFFMSQVILTLFFFVVVTPIGLLARLFRKDFLGRKLEKDAASYWVRYPKEPKAAESYYRQF